MQTNTNFCTEDEKCFVVVSIRVRNFNSNWKRENGGKKVAKKGENTKLLFFSFHLKIELIQIPNIWKLFLRNYIDCHLKITKQILHEFLWFVRK